MRWCRGQRYGFNQYELIDFRDVIQRNFSSYSLPKEVYQEPGTLIIFNLVYGTNEFRKGAPLNFDAVARSNFTKFLNNAIFVAPSLKALDDTRADGSINAVERDGLGYTSRPVNTLPWDGGEWNAHKKVPRKQRGFDI